MANIKKNNKPVKQSEDIVEVAVEDVVEREPNLQSKTATENGVVVADEGYDGLSKVTVAYEPILQNITVEKNGTYVAEEGFDGLGAVKVDVQGGSDVVRNMKHFFDFPMSINTPVFSCSFTVSQ